MGYTVTTLKNLPVHLGYYFFLIGDYRNTSPINDFFRDNFDQIAERLGEDAGIIKQTRNSRIANELTNIMQGHMFTETKLSHLLDSLASEYPGLLITKNHPNLLTEKSPILHIPFDILDEIYKNRSNDLLRDLVALSKVKMM